MSCSSVIWEDTWRHTMSIAGSIPPPICRLISTILVGWVPAPGVRCSVWRIVAVHCQGQLKPSSPEFAPKSGWDHSAGNTGKRFSSVDISVKHKSCVGNHKQHTESGGLDRE